MKWPRGKYNGLRIVGASIKLKVDITSWRWIPRPWGEFGGAFVWLCFLLWIEWEFESPFRT